MSSKVEKVFIFLSVCSSLNCITSTHATQPEGGKWPAEEEDSYEQDEFTPTVPSTHLYLDSVHSCQSPHSKGLEENNQQHRKPRILIKPTPPARPERIVVNLPKETHCLKVFEDNYCNLNHNQNAFLQFAHVNDNIKELKLNSAHKNYKRLLNFNLNPNSFQLCNDMENESSKMRETQCQSSFRLDIEGTSTTTIDVKDNACIPLNDPPPLHRPQMHLHVLRYKPKDNICLETFTTFDCTGDTVRVLLPYNSSMWSHHSWNNESRALIWEYYSDSWGNPILEIDINSVRRCTYCLNDLEETSSLLPQQAAQSNAKEIPSSTNNAGIEKEPIFSNVCKFQTCTAISNLIKNDTTAINLSSDKDCYFYFNDSDCSTYPILRERNPVNLTIVNLTIKKDPTFLSWMVAECVEDEIPSNCSELVPKSNLTIYLAFRTSKPRSPMEQPWLSKVEIIVLSLAGSLALIMLVFVIIMALLLWRKKRQIRAIMRLRYYPNKNDSQRAHILHQADSIEANDYVNDVTGLKALCASFTGAYVISRDRINIGNIRDSTACIIGVGEISTAFKGRLEPQGRTVAVKTMKSGQATTRSIKAALKEAQIFMQLGKHPGILELLGVCMENVRDGEIFIVTAWCENGSLKGFLAQQKSHFVSLVQDGEWVDNEKLQRILESNSFIEKGPPVKFNTMQLYKWCLEVADAMEFLAVRKVVHVTLSARNVLLDYKFGCKISDFHLAKVGGDLVPSGSFSTLSNASLNRERLIPWRWCAVESLVDDVFSTQSDVWTFGVFMWEVFSLGAIPYPEYSFGSEFTLCIKHGYRLQAPNFSTVECYQLMLMCWYDAAEKRPSFTKLKVKLDEITPKKNMPIPTGSSQVIRL